MKVVDLQKQKSYYENLTEKARKEMIEAIKERDGIFSEINDQRNGLKEVSSILYRKQAKKGDAIVLLKALNNDLKYKRNFFCDISEKEKIILTNIKNKLSILNIHEKEIEELSTTQTEEENKIQCIQKRIEPLITKENRLKDKNAKLKAEIEANILKVKIPLTKLKTKKEGLDIKAKELNNKETKLNIREKRLKAYSLTLKKERQCLEQRKP